MAGLALCAVAFALLWPHARDAYAILAAQDDPAELSDLQLILLCGITLRCVAENIEAALAANDADLADSFVSLAREKNIPVGDELLKRVSDTVAEQSSTSHYAKRFLTGLVVGEADDVASLSGTVAGDLFVFGDIRDVVREGKHLAMGEDTDRLVLGLAAVGLVVTAATYVSVGGVAPLRAGLTLVKDARKVGRLGEGLTQWAGRSAREMVDAPVLQHAVASGSVLRPGQTMTAIKAAFRAEKAGALVRLAKDVGRVGEKAGYPRRAGHAEDRRRPQGCCARRAAGGVQGRPDPRDPESARSRRAVAGRRGLQSDAVGVRRAGRAVRLSVLDQGHHRTPDHGVSAPQKGAAAAPADGGARPSRPMHLWRAPSRTARIAASPRSPIPFPKNTERPMPSFHNGDVEIAYLDEGEGDPILLVHGFASTKNVNWVYPTWVSELRKNGRRVIALRQSRPWRFRQAL